MNSDDEEEKGNNNTHFIGHNSAGLGGIEGPDTEEFELLDGAMMFEQFGLLGRGRDKHRRRDGRMLS